MARFVQIVIRQMDILTNQSWFLANMLMICFLFIMMLIRIYGIEELHHETKVIEANDAIIAEGECTVKTQEVNKKSLLKAGVIMLLAIALHNLPEGMAIGATGLLFECR